VKRTANCVFCSQSHPQSRDDFIALQRLAKLHEGSDTNLYFSPIKQRGRPIELILFAFHAFGNGALFHRKLLKKEASLKE